MTAPHRIITVVAAAILHDQKCLIARRRDVGTAAGKWEFPGGKIEPGEGPEEALIREIAEELALPIRVQRFVGASVTNLRSKSIELRVYTAEPLESPNELVMHAHSQVLWVRGAELENFDFAEPDLPLLAPVRKVLEER